jgi:PTS system nitrogen regulatory IIA component
VPETLKNNALTVKDVAEMLKISPRAVLNMAKKGEIPACRVGHLWRFDEEKVQHWLKEQSRAQRRGNGGKFSEKLPQSIISLISPEQVRFEKSVPGRREILENIASLLAGTQKLCDYSGLLRSLEEREDMHPTALEEGIAFPHPRRPIAELDEPILVILIVASGVDFGAPEGGKTFVFFSFCAPDEATHVRILARLARLFYRRKKLISKLRHISQPEQVIKELIRAEKEKINPVKQKRSR